MFEIKRLDYKDIQAVAELHQMMIPYSLNSKLGRDHLTEAYKMICKDPSSFVMGAYIRNEPVGVVIVSLHPQKLMAKLLSSLNGRQFLRLFSKFILNPLLLFDCMESLWSEFSVKFKHETVNACLVAIAVAPEAQKKGIGRALIQAVDDFFRAQGCCYYHLDSRIDNSGSREFYRKMDFIELEHRGRNIIWVKELLNNKNEKNITAVSVVMPTYNEGGNIRDLILDTVKSIKTMHVPKIELIVVDDNSPDRTYEIASNTVCPDAVVRVIRRLNSPGLTSSLREGVTAASHDIVVWLDCDFSHPPDKIPQMLYMLTQGFDVVVNSRYVVGGSENRAGKGGPIQIFLSTLLNWSVRFLLYPAFSDYTSGFIAVRREVLNDITLRGDYGEYFVDFIFRALRKKYRICELPYECFPRRSGESKTGKNTLDYLRRGWKYYAAVVKLRFLDKGD